LTNEILKDIMLDTLKIPCPYSHTSAILKRIIYWWAINFESISSKTKLTN